MLPNDLAGRLDPRGNVNRGDEYSELDAYAYLRKQLHQRAANDRRWLGHGDRVPNYKPEERVPSSDIQEKMYELNKRNAETATKNASYNYDVLEAINPHEARSTQSSEMFQLMNKFGPGGAGFGGPGGGPPGIPPGGRPPGAPRGPDGQPIDMAALSEADRNELQRVQAQGGSVTQRNVAARRIRSLIQHAVDNLGESDAEKNELMNFFTDILNRHLDRVLDLAMSMDRLVLMAYARSGLWMLSPRPTERAFLILMHLLADQPQLSIKLDAAKSILSDIARQIERGRLQRVNYLDSRSVDSILSPNLLGQTCLWVFLTGVLSSAIAAGHHLNRDFNRFALVETAWQISERHDALKHSLGQILLLLNNQGELDEIERNYNINPENVLIAQARNGDLMVADPVAGIVNVHTKEGEWHDGKPAEQLSDEQKQQLHQAIADLHGRPNLLSERLVLSNDRKPADPDNFPQDDAIFGEFQQGAVAELLLGMLRDRGVPLRPELIYKIENDPTEYLKSLVFMVAFHTAIKETDEIFAFRKPALELGRELERGKKLREINPSSHIDFMSSDERDARFWENVPDLLDRIEFYFNLLLPTEQEQADRGQIDRFYEDCGNAIGEWAREKLSAYDTIDRLNPLRHPGLLPRDVPSANPAPATASASSSASASASSLPNAQQQQPASFNMSPEQFMNQFNQGNYTVQEYPMIPPGPSPPSGVEIVEMNGVWRARVVEENKDQSSAASPAQPAVPVAPAAPSGKETAEQWGERLKADGWFYLKLTGGATPHIRQFVRLYYRNPNNAGYVDKNGNPADYWDRLKPMVMYPDSDDPNVPNQVVPAGGGAWHVVFHPSAFMPLTPIPGPGAMAPVNGNMEYFMQNAGFYQLPGVPSAAGGAGLEKRKLKDVSSPNGIPSRAPSVRGRGRGRVRVVGRGSENYIIKPDPNSAFHPPPVPRPGVRPSGGRGSARAGSPSTKKSKVNNPAYGSFGNKFISTPHLESHEVRMVYGTGRAVPGFPKRSASPELARCIHDVVHGGSVSAASFHKLNSEDRAYFNKMAKNARLSQTGKHNHMAKQDHDALERLAVLCGMRENGNDSAEVKDEIKRLVKFCLDQSLLTRARATKILAWIA